MNMELRDYFAGQALAGYAASGLVENLIRAQATKAIPLVAQGCYLLADALLAERAK